MTEFTIKLADIPIRIEPVEPKVSLFMRQYLSEEEPELTITMQRADIERERALEEANCAREGRAPVEFSERRLEFLAIYRKLAETLVDRDIVLFHGSAIAVDGDAYLFTARSGTGKSTHARLWREVFGDRAVMVNDDKPLLRIAEDGVRVFGTPWCGKHRLGENISAPLKALCILTRAAENRIERISAEDAFMTLYQQCYRPEEPERIRKTLELLERMSRNVRIYRLGCNMTQEAALVSYYGMQEETG